MFGSSQGPKGASDSKGSQGDASTPAMPSMSGATTASSYSDKKQPLSGQGRSNSKISHNPTSSSDRVETVSGIPTSSSEGTEDMKGRGPQGGGGAAGFDPPLRVQKLIAQVKRFMEEHMYAAEHVLEAHAKDPKTKWTIHPSMDELKVRCGVETVLLSLHMFNISTQPRSKALTDIDLALAYVQSSYG